MDMEVAVDEDINDSDHNPSFPPELLQDKEILNADRIGDTVFSKHWVFQCLLNVMQAVQSEGTEESDANNSMIELRKDIEEEMCALWDMSANSDVAHLLHEFRAIDILMGVIDQTKAPRLVEIAVGILGNMACFDDIGRSMSSNNDFLISVLSLMESSESYILVQVVRLIQSLVAINNDENSFCITTIKNSDLLQNRLLFILQNSLNSELLHGTLQLLCRMLVRDTLQPSWLNTEHSEAIVQALKQLKSTNSEGVETAWQVLHLLSLNEEDSTYSGCWEDILSEVREYVMSFNEAEDIVPSLCRADTVVAALSTLVAIIRCNSVARETLVNDHLFFNFLSKMLKSVEKKICSISKGPTESQNGIPDANAMAMQPLDEDSLASEDSSDALHRLLESLNEITETSTLSEQLNELKMDNRSH